MIQLYDSGGLSGYDYEGCPVWFDIIGTMDPRGLLMSASKQDMIRKRIKVCELLQRECELQSQKVSSGVQAAGMEALVCPGGGTRPRKEQHLVSLTLARSQYDFLPL